MLTGQGLFLAGVVMWSLDIWGKGNGDLGAVILARPPSEYGRTPCTSAVCKSSNNYPFTNSNSNKIVAPPTKGVPHQHRPDNTSKTAYNISKTSIRPDAPKMRYDENTTLIRKTLPILLQWQLVVVPVGFPENGLNARDNRRKRERVEY